MVKKIHYCWFGGKELPASVKKCINTWKRLMPDYEIIEWNEKNFDISINPFVKEAYENKKWAFVSDYVRIYALYQEGGIYFDTDMKVIKDVTNIVDKEMFLGYEDSGYVGTAVIGVKDKNNKYIKEILDYYNKLEHFNTDIMYNYANPVIITKILNKYESYVNDAGIRIFNKEIYVYPRDYFYPLSYNYAEKVYTENTCMIHLFNATWTDKGERRVIGIYRKFGPRLGKKINTFIDKIFGIKNNTISSMKRLYNFMRMKYSIHFNISKRLRKINEKLNGLKDNYIVVTNPEMVEKNEQINKMFKGNLLEIREMHTIKEAKRIAKAIINSRKELIIFNSYSNGWDNIIVDLKRIKRNIKIKILIKGGETLLSAGNNWDDMNTIIDLYNKGLIDEFGFFKKSLYDFFKQKGYNCKYISKYPYIENIENYNKENKKEYVKLGMYEAYDNTLKNIYNQLSAISLLENIKLDFSPINYKVAMMARKFNINLCGVASSLSKEEMFSRMCNNDINLFISLGDNSELLPMYSFELGTICLVGSNYEYINGSGLEKYIVVKNEDNIIEISKMINYALENKEKILELYNEWKDKNKQQSIDSITEFLKI